MGGAALSNENFNAREIALSSDLNRLQRLVLREVADELAARGGDSAGAPVSSVDAAVAAAGAGGGFVFTFAANRGWYYAPSLPGLTADDSAFTALRWAVTPLTFGNPD